MRSACCSTVSPTTSSTCFACSCLCRCAPHKSKPCARSCSRSVRVSAKQLVASAFSWPAAGQVKADATSCFADTRTDLEQLRAQGFDLCGAHRQRQLQAKQVDEVVGETVEQQAERIGSEAVTAQAVRGKTILEFFNAVLTLPAIVIEGEN